MCACGVSVLFGKDIRLFSKIPSILELFWILNMFHKVSDCASCFAAVVCTQIDFEIDGNKYLIISGLYLVNLVVVRTGKNNRLFISIDFQFDLDASDSCKT